MDDPAGREIQRLGTDYVFELRAGFLGYIAKQSGWPAAFGTGMLSGPSQSRSAESGRSERTGTLPDEPLDGNEALPYWIDGQKQALQS